MIGRIDYFDFRGGVNTRYSIDSLSKNELREAKNARLDVYAAARKRSGSQRLHVNPLDSGADVLGVFQWDNPSQASELLAVAGGNLYHKALADANYTEVSSSLSTTNRPWFAKFTVSGTDTLFITDGSLRKWTGTTLSTSVSGAPAGAKYCAVYKSRLFIAGDDKVLYWSEVANPENWASPDGGQANIETYDDDEITGLATVGSSLLIFKRNNIARFSGTSIDNIQIGQETEGVSPEIGCIAPRSIVRVENFVFFLSDRGPYIATEGGVQQIGDKIEDQFLLPDGQYLENAVACHNRNRREVWLFVPQAGDTENTVAWVWNYRVQAWSGPQTVPYNVLSADRLEDADGNETVMFGGTDGIVRDGDVEAVGGKDDVRADGTGGSKIELVLEFPDMLMGDPASVKLLHHTQHVQANLGEWGELEFVTSGEQVRNERTLRADSKGADVYDYAFRPAWRGRRPVLKLKEGTDQLVTVHGVSLTATAGRRDV